MTRKRRGAGGAAGEVRTYRKIGRRGEREEGLHPEGGGGRAEREDRLGSAPLGTFRGGDVRAVNLLELCKLVADRVGEPRHG